MGFLYLSHKPWSSFFSYITSRRPIRSPYSGKCAFLLLSIVSGVSTNKRFLLLFPALGRRAKARKECFWSRDMSCQAFEICRFACNHLRVLRKGLTMAILIVRSLLAVQARCGRCVCPQSAVAASVALRAKSVHATADPPCRLLWRRLARRRANQKQKKMW